MNRIIKHDVIIKAINENSLLVATEDRGDQIIHLKDVVILESDLFTNVSVSSLIVGDSLLVVMNELTPFALSEPPQYTPLLIIVDRNIFPLFSSIVTLDDNYVSLDNSLKVNVEAIEKHIILGENNDLVGQQLIVLYDVSTRSIPPIVNPKAVINL